MDVSCWGPSGRRLHRALSVPVMRQGTPQRLPDEAERCWNYTQAAQSGPRITKIITYLTYLIFWCVLVSAGGTFLFLIFLLLKNLF